MPLIPKVHFVKRARRPVPKCGIKVGDSYYWWKKRRPGQRDGYKVYSKTKPTTSQLVTSPFYSELYRIEEDADSGVELEELLEALDELKATQQECYDNLPQSLQESASGELFLERIEECETLRQDLESRFS